MNRKSRILLVFGMLALVLGSLSLRLPSTGMLDGLKGMLYGLAIGLNFMALRARRSDAGC